jgi:NADH:ubiquinone oxidoreductase subunit C
VERQELLSAVQARFEGVAADNASQHPTVKVGLAQFRALMQWLHDEPALALDYPQSMTAVDWPEAGAITCVYHLYSMKHRHNLVVHCDTVRAEPLIPTVSDLWRGCEWFEREVFDLFGVRFEGHPDLRRIMLTDDWVGYPLRKDYKDSRIAGKPY